MSFDSGETIDENFSASFTRVSRCQSKKLFAIIEKSTFFQGISHFVGYI